MNKVAVLSFILQEYFGPFTMLPVKGPLKGDFLDRYLSTFFGVHIFGIKSAMRVIFFSKMLKI